MQSEIVAFGSGRRDLLDRVRRQHDDAAALEPHPFRLRPDAQLLVHALAAGAGQQAQLALRDGKLARSRSTFAFLAEANEQLGESARQIEEYDFLELLAGPAQPRAQQRDHAERDAWLLAHQREKVAPIDRDQLTVGHRDGVSGARLTVEQRNLAENLTLVDEVEHGLAAIERGHADFHDARADGEQARARVILREDRRAALDLPDCRATAQAFDNLWSKAAEQRMLAKLGDLLRRGLHCAPCEDDAACF